MHPATLPPPTTPPHSHASLAATALALLLAVTACGDALVEPPRHADPSAQQMLMPRQATDRAALVALYEATGGPDWTRSDNWLTDKPLNEWYGIGVDDSDRVTGIRLRENGLEGTLPREIGDLGRLRYLHLGDNALSGPIPAELGDLGRLGALFLRGQRPERTAARGAGGTRQPEGVLGRQQRARGRGPPRVQEPWAAVLRHRGQRRPVPARQPRVRELGAASPALRRLVVRRGGRRGAPGPVRSHGRRELDQLRRLARRHRPRTGWHGVETDSLRASVTGLDLSVPTGFPGIAPGRAGRSWPGWLRSMCPTTAFPANSRKRLESWPGWPRSTSRATGSRDSFPSSWATSGVLTVLNVGSQRLHRDRYRCLCENTGARGTESTRTRGCAFPTIRAFGNWLRTDRDTRGYGGNVRLR